MRHHSIALEGVHKRLCGSLFDVCVYTDLPPRQPQNLVERRDAGSGETRGKLDSRV